MLKNEVGDPHFLLLENNQYATVKLSATLQKGLGSEFRATLLFRKVKRAFTGSLVAYYVKIINESYLALILLSNDTIIFSLSDTQLSYNSIKRHGL